MRLDLRLLAAGLTLVSSVAFAAAPADETSGMTANFSVTETTVVPSATLAPGSYSIKVVDHLADRLIVRIENADSKVQSTFIGLRDPNLAKSAKTGAISFGTGINGEPALRGYEFPGGTALQFVYPKADAVTLAKANSTRVVAIDPASEGRSTDPSLSKGDMEVVTLWTLIAQPVGPGDSGPGIKAERYQVAASVKPPKPGIAQLPHTSSLLPLVGLMMVSFPLGAFALRRMRLQSPLA